WAVCCSDGRRPVWFRGRASRKGARMLEFDSEKVRRNVRAATTEDLLDRVTAYRAGMEADAIVMIEAELAGRGAARADIEQYEADHCADLIRRPEGFAYRCSFCHRPA